MDVPCRKCLELEYKLEEAKKTLGWIDYIYKEYNTEEFIERLLSSMLFIEIREWLEYFEQEDK